ncbi:MAG: DUF5662 family protein [Firmicutes bacterium]|nr:DUF5662 family protein [Bacillota bacterium]
MYKKPLKNMNKAERRYAAHLEQHIAAVNLAYELLVEYGIVKFDPELARQIQDHDKSKWDPEEFGAAARWFFGKKKRSNKAEFMCARNRHASLNPHHSQYWKQRDEEMPYNYIIEKICDWMSFGILAGDLSELPDWYVRKNGKTKQEYVERLKTEALLEKVARIDLKPRELEALKSKLYEAEIENGVLPQLLSLTGLKEINVAGSALHKAVYDLKAKHPVIFQDYTFDESAYVPLSTKLDEEIYRLQTGGIVQFVAPAFRTAAVNQGALGDYSKSKKARLLQTVPDLISSFTESVSAPPQCKQREL